MTKECRFQNFAHPKRRHLIEFCEFSNDSEAAAAQYRRGHELEWQDGKLDEASAAYRRAIELDSHYSDAYMGLANICAKQDRLEKAIAYSQQASGLYGWDLCGERDYKFTDNWFSQHIPVWQKYLEPFAHKAALHVLEIGSYQGMSTCWLLDNILTHASAKIVCVDPFWPPYGQKFIDNIYDTGAFSKVVRITNNSQDALSVLKPSAYDFIYIDGDHDDNVVLYDAVSAWHLVKVGGLLMFDDYGHLDAGQSTKVGTDQFLSLFNSSIEEVYRGYQVFLRKTSNTVDPETIPTLQRTLSQESLSWLSV